MMNIMIYIQQNYQTHFRDIKVDQVENEILNLHENHSPFQFNKTIPNSPIN